MSASILLLALGSVSLSQQPSQKVIKDQKEYNAYIAALNTSDPVQKAAAMEAFINQYPNSIVKSDAMEQEMAAYQQAGNVAKVGETADRILQLYPENVRALAIAAYIKRDQGTKGDAKASAEAGAMAERGLKALPDWPKPEGLSDVAFKQLSDQMAEIFYGAAGFALLQTKDYAHSRAYYLKSVQLDPTNFQDVYQLSIADLEMRPLDVDGFWYVAKALSIAQKQANQTAAQSIKPYAQAVYRRYHGGDDGWDNIVTAAANQSSPPTGFAGSIKRAPTPAEVAVKAVAENDPASLSFSDFEYILSYRDASPENKQAAERVWQTIQAKQKNGEVKLSMSVKVISATKTIIEAAITDDNQKSNKADLEISTEAPMASPPAPGSQINIIGVLIEYKLKPFMFIMKQGKLP
jgi:tetratricopeptide (TPR) repeat protein